MSRSHDKPLTFPNLIPGQTYLAFSENGSILQKSDRIGVYRILSRNDSFEGAYLIVADNGGTLKIGYHGDEVCVYVCVYMCGSVYVCLWC